MNAEIREQWSGIRDIQKDLEKSLEGEDEQAIYLMSVKRRKPATIEGRISVATPQVAAAMIFQETHRLATPAEIAEWKKEQTARGARLRQQQASKDAKVSVDLGPIVNQLVAQAQQNAPAPANSGSGHTGRPA